MQVSGGSSSINASVIPPRNNMEQIGQTIIRQCDFELPEEPENKQISFYFQSNLSGWKGLIGE